MCTFNSPTGRSVTRQRSVRREPAAACGATLSLTDAWTRLQVSADSIGSPPLFLAKPALRSIQTLPWPGIRKLR